MILLDTNVPTRVMNVAIADCHVARAAIRRFLARRERLIIVPQDLYGFWAVATRRPGAPPHGRNGLGMDPERAGLRLAFFRRRLNLRPDRDDLPTRWLAIVRAQRVMGNRAQDARLVAAMESYGVTRRLTFNVGDFVGCPVTVIHPSEA